VVAISNIITTTTAAAAAAAAVIRDHRHRLPPPHLVPLRPLPLQQQQVPQLLVAALVPLVKRRRTVTLHPLEVEWVEVEVEEDQCRLHHRST
jgi:hypothetical protein